MKKLILFLFSINLVMAQTNPTCVTPPSIIKSTTQTTSGVDEACLEIDLNEGFETIGDIDYTALIGNTGNGENGGSLVGLVANGPTEKISLLIYPKNNQIWLRWIPTVSSEWYLACKRTYKVSRSQFVGGVWTAPTEIASLNGIQKPDSTLWFLDTDSLSYALYDATQDEIADLTSPDGQEDLFFQYFSASAIYNQRYDLAIKSSHGFKDLTAVAGGIYKYTVTCDLGTGTIIGSGPPLEITNSSAGALPQTDVKLSKENNQQKPKVEVTWPAASLRRYYANYDLYRAAGAGAFVKVNKYPIMFNEKMINGSKDGVDSLVNNADISWVDTLQNVTQIYKYKVSALTYFGDYKDFNIKEISIKKNYLAKPYIDSVYKFNPSKLALKWKMEGSINNSELVVDGGSIWVNDTTVKSTYKLLSNGLNPNILTKSFEKSLLVGKVDTSRSFYYQLQFKTIDGDTLFSTPYFVLPSFNAKPAKPTGFSFSQTNNVIQNKESYKLIKLTWNANTEQDLEGYKVTRRIGLTDSLVVISGIKYEKVTVDGQELRPVKGFASLVAYDTLATNVTYPDIYYGLSAVDDFNNESDTLQIKLASVDIIRPYPPSIIKATQVFNAVSNIYNLELQIIYSPEKTASHKLYVSNAQILGDTSAAVFSPSGITEFLSTSRTPTITTSALESNKTYSIYMVSIDQAGNRSCFSELGDPGNLSNCEKIMKVDILGSSIPKSSIIDTFARKTPIQSDLMEIKWTLGTGINDNTIQEFEIYKSEYLSTETVIPKERLYKIVKSTERYFIDYEAVKGSNNKYFIRAILSNGKMSEWRTLTVNY